MEIVVLRRHKNKKTKFVVRIDGQKFESPWEKDPRGTLEGTVFEKKEIKCKNS
jgi:hypothetical protein